MSKTNNVQIQLKYCRNRLREKSIISINEKPLSYSNKKTLFNKYEEIYGVPFIDYWNNIVEQKRQFKKSIITNGKYVYCFINEEFGFCKIGYSNNPIKRMGNIQVGCPFTLSLLGFIEGDTKIEKKIHCLFSKYRTRGEWFRFEDDLKDFCIKKFTQNNME